MEEPEVVEIPEDDEATMEGEEEVLEDDPLDARLCALMSDAIFKGFERHVQELMEARKRRQEALAFKSAVEEEGAAADEEGGAAQTQDELDGMGVQLPTDKWRGDTNMRTLQKLLSRVDARGFERSAQQLEFHQAFMKAAARVIYRGDWETDRPMIMDKYGWTKCNSEVLISTPRRFGKTFRQAVHPRTNRHPTPHHPLWMAASQFSAPASRWPLVVRASNRALPPTPHTRETQPVRPRGGRLLPSTARLAQAARADCGVRPPRRQPPRAALERASQVHTLGRR